MFSEPPAGSGRIYLLSADSACLVYRDKGSLQRIEIKPSPALFEAMGRIRQLDAMLECDPDGSLSVSIFRAGPFLNSSAPPRSRLELGA
jgi:hypothetical protein